MWACHTKEGHPYDPTLTPFIALVAKIVSAHVITLPFLYLLVLWIDIWPMFHQVCHDPFSLYGFLHIELTYNSLRTYPSIESDV